MPLLYKMAVEKKPLNNLTRIEEATRCQYCLQSYRDPRSLSCGHSFCKKCIAQYVVKKSVSCLKCDKSSHVPHGDPDKLIKNLALVGLVDAYQNPYAEPCLKCAECRVYERREAVDHCHTCQKSLCSLCSESHTNSRHGVVAIADYEADSVKMQDITTRSLINRTGAKTRALSQRLQLVNTQMKRVESASAKITADARQSFSEHLRHLQESRNRILEETSNREEFLLTKFKTVCDYTRGYMESLSKISTNLLLSNNKLLRGETLKNHIALCHELEALLQDDIDVDILQEASAFAEAFEFRANKPHDVGSVKKAEADWRLRFDKLVPNRGAIRSMCGTPDGRISIGYSKNNGGLSLLSPDGTWECPRSMEGILVRSVAFLPDGRCAILDVENKLRFYDSAFEQLSITFKTLNNDAGGAGQLCIDDQHFIYLAYKTARKVHVFSPKGGDPLKEIKFSKIDSIDLRVSPGGDLLLASWRKVVMLNQKGEVQRKLQHIVSDELVVADVSRDKTVIIASVSQGTGNGGTDLLTVRRYSQDSEFTLQETLFKDHPIEISPVPFYCIRELITGEIVFCTKDKVYLFQKCPEAVNDVGFADYDVTNSTI